MDIVIKITPVLALKIKCVKETYAKYRKLRHGQNLAVVIIDETDLRFLFIMARTLETILTLKKRYIV